MYTGSLRRIRFHFDNVRGLVEQVKFELREVAKDFARRGRNIELELIRGDWDIIFCKKNSTLV